MGLGHMLTERVPIETVSTMVVEFYFFRLIRFELIERVGETLLMVVELGSFLSWSDERYVVAIGIANGEMMDFERA